MTHKPFNFLMTVLFLSFSSGCTGETLTSLDPLFEGLPAGKSSEDGCITVGDKSVRLTFEDFDQELSVFGSSGCRKGEKVKEKTVTAETQFAGIWNQFVVLDEGTDSSSRELHLLHISDDEQKYSFNYTLSPVFQDTTVNYYEPLDIPAKAEECPEQQAEIKEWLEMQFALAKAEEKVFDLETGAATSTGKTKCYALQ